MFYIEKKETITAKFNDINNANFAAMMNLIKEQGKTENELKEMFAREFLKATYYTDTSKAAAEYKPILNSWTKENGMIKAVTTINFVYQTNISFLVAITLDEGQGRVVGYTQTALAQTEALSELVCTSRNNIRNAYYQSMKKEKLVALGVDEETYKEIQELKRQQKQQEIFKKVMREEAKKWKEEHKKSS